MNSQNKKKVYVFDSYAFISYYQEEAGYQQVADILLLAKEKKCKIYFSLINFGEVAYIAERRFGTLKTIELLGEIKNMPIIFESVNEQIILEAAKIKAGNKLSYADSFVVSLAITKNGIIVSGDPEITELRNLVRIESIPRY